MEVNNKTASIMDIRNSDKNISDSSYKLKKELDTKGLYKDSKEKNENFGYDEKIEKILKNVNEKFKVINKEFSYELHDKTNRFIVKIKDSQTGDLIKEIPSEQSLDLFASMLEMVGLLVDKKS